MAFCTHCGGEVPINAAFCPFCGQPAAQQLPDGGAAPLVETPVNTVPVVQQPVMPAVNTAAPVYTQPVYSAAEYSLVLASLGTCRRSYADDVLQDIMGYTNAEANLLVRQVPVQIAQNLTMEQAQYIAQALTEYGMQVAIYLGDAPVDLGQYATSSVFNSDGSLIGAALAAIAGVTAVNRLRRFTRWNRPSLLERLFTPRYRAPEPPRHVRRQIRRQIRRDPVIRREPEPHRVVGSPRAIERANPGRTVGFGGGRSAAPSGGRMSSPAGGRQGGDRSGGPSGGRSGGPSGGRSGGPGGGRGR